jgi:hypothetical protein
LRTCAEQVHSGLQLGVRPHRLGLDRPGQHGGGHLMGITPISLFGGAHGVVDGELRRRRGRGAQVVVRQGRDVAAAGAA